nr:hypothetical protein [Brevundimonas denitrificans]
MTTEHHATPGFDDQAPGTSGLRRPTRRFMEPQYLETFIQALFEVAAPPEGATLIVGGDGRFFSDQAAATVIRMAAAHGFGRVLVGQGGCCRPRRRRIWCGGMRRSARSFCRPATIPADRTAISASSSTAPRASRPGVPDRRGP